MRSLIACFVGLGLVVAAGCGGKVEVSSTGTPGTGGSGGAGSTTTSSTNGTTTSVSTNVATSTSTGAGGGDLQGDCETICKVTAAQACGGAGATCVNDCVSSYQQVQGCQPQYLAYLDCLAAHAGEIVQCSAPASCDPELQAFTQCTQGGATGGMTGGGGCGPEECSGTQESCDCKQTCNGQSFEVACKISGPNGQASCTCSTTDTVGSCNEPTLACGALSSCCKGFFTN